MSPYPGGARVEESLVVESWRRLGLRRRFFKSWASVHLPFQWFALFSSTKTNSERRMPPLNWKVRELLTDDAFYLWKLARYAVSSLIIGDFLQSGNEQSRHQMDTHRTIKLSTKTLTDVSAFVRVSNGLQRILAILSEVLLHSMLLKDPFAVGGQRSL